MAYWSAINMKLDPSAYRTPFYPKTAEEEEVPSETVEEVEESRPAEESKQSCVIA